MINSIDFLVLTKRLPRWKIILTQLWHLTASSTELQEERIKREREHKKKQEALTIEETKEEIANIEAKLQQLKEEKHQLFHTLKKVR